jgi:predicted ATPase
VVVGGLLPLVARAGALAEVDSVLAAARTGRGALVAVTGEPGIGKTRLAEAAADRAAGFEVIWTWCLPAAGGAPLRPWARLVRTLAAGPRRGWWPTRRSWPRWPVRPATRAGSG